MKHFTTTKNVLIVFCCLVFLPMAANAQKAPCDGIFEINQTPDVCQSEYEYEMQDFEGDVPDSIIWHWDNGDSQTQTSPPFVVSRYYAEPGTYHITVVRYFSGCDDSKSVSTTVEPLPVTRINLVGDNTDPGIINSTNNILHCDNELSIEVELETASPGATYQVSWQHGGVAEPIAAGQQLSHTYTNGAYNLTVIGENTTTGCIDSTNYHVVVEKIPSFDLSRAPSTPGCAPHTEAITLTPDVFPYTTYIWDWGDGQTDTLDLITEETVYEHQYGITSGGQNFLIQNNTICEDCFGITVVASNEYCDAAIAVQAIAPIIVYDKPAARFEISALDSLMADSVIYDTTNLEYHSCITGDFLFKNLSRAGFGLAQSDTSGFADTVQWTFYNEEGAILDSYEFLCTQDTCEDEVIRTILQRGLYTTHLRQANYCGASDTVIELRLGYPPELEFDIMETDLCYPATINFNNTSTTEITWFMWDFGDQQADSINLSPEHTFFEKGEYHVIFSARDAYCKSAVDTTLILSEPCENLRVPNAFLPGSDDPRFRVFKPVADNLISYQIEIFNLAGQMLWSSGELVGGKPKQGWDGTYKGKPCPPGTYIWKIEALIEDGTPGGRRWDGYGQEDRTVGKLMLIR